jgi:serine/threonine-protein kinase
MPDPRNALNTALTGRYRLDQELGRGGMATVYLAWDLKHERHVALKVLLPELAAALGGDRFLREIRLTARLRHPHILPLLDSGEAAGLLYYVMPYVEGESLRDRLRRERQLAIEDAVRIAEEVADALDHAHQLGVVHRDIKPENILLDGRHAVVADFGIATAASLTGGEKLTATGVVVGTVEYMSPEQAAGEGELDHRSDLYALGCVLYEMVAGHPPFTGTTAQQVIARHLIDTAPSLEAARPGLPAPVARAIERALAKAPADRFGSAAAFARSLRSEAAAPPPAGLPPASVSRTGRTPALRRRAVWGVGAVLVVAALVLATNPGNLRHRAGTAGAPRIESLAVLPLDNLSNDPEQEYFADGMTEALIGNLTQIRALRVTSRTSAMRYKGSTQSLPAIAGELGVDGVITGSVQRSAARISIRVQLIHGPTDRTLWAQAYVRDLEDVLELQRDVAQAIAQEVSAQLTPGEQVRLAAVRPVNAEAYSRYLQGRFYLAKRSAKDLDRAITYFEGAIARDSLYAPAHSGLADAYSLLGYFGSGAVAPTDARSRAGRAARRAVELDDGSAEAHTSMGFVRMRFEWDWAGAEREFLRAIELNPRYPTAHHWYAVMLMSLGRHEEAHGEIMLAREMDPVSVIIANVVALHFYLARDYDQATEWVRRTLELEPQFANGYYSMGRLHVQRGEYAQAVREMETAVRLANRTPFYLGQLGRALAHAGRGPEAERVLEELISRPAPEQSAYQIAEIYIGLGEATRALDWLERAFEGRAGYLSYLNVAPEMDPLREEPRFQALVRKMNLQ